MESTFICQPCQSNITSTKKSFKEDFIIRDIHWYSVIIQFDKRSNYTLWHSIKMDCYLKYGRNFYFKKLCLLKYREQSTLKNIFCYVRYSFLKWHLKICKVLSNSAFMINISIIFPSCYQNWSNRMEQKSMVTGWKILL